MSRLFFGVMGAPYAGEEITTLFRMIDAAIEQQHDVTVWTCGGATLLTQESTGPVLPRNLLALGTPDGERDHPTTANVIRQLMDRAQGRLRWLVCRHCMQERGALAHIPGAKVTSPFKYLHYMQAADSSLVLGKK